MAGATFPKVHECTIGGCLCGKPSYAQELLRLYDGQRADMIARAVQVSMTAALP